MCCTFELRVREREREKEREEGVKKGDCKFILSRI